MTTRLALGAALGLMQLAAAQQLATSPLIEGQLANCTVTGAEPSSFVFLIASVTGTAPGPCLMPGPSACIGLAAPLLVVDAQIASPNGGAGFVLPIPHVSSPVSIHMQAVEVTFSGPDLQFAVSNTTSEPVQSIDALGDDFEGTGLDDSWQILHPQLATIEVATGALHITPLVGGGNNIWYHDGEGPLVYRNVTGDFTVSAIVRAHQPGDPATPPAINYRLGGLLVRDPGATAPGTHDWAHIATGAGVASSPAAVENKTTVDSNSVFALTAVPVPTLELRVRRRGSTIIESYRQLGAPAWITLATYDYPTFPATLQVGMMAYSANSAPGITVSFDGIEFSP